MLAEGTIGLEEAIADDVEIVSESNEETLAVTYSITSYGLDFDVDGLVRRLDRGDIEIPDFQRDFVWTQAISSRFIESLLLGLPVPGIFLYRMENSKYQVIDGQQRLRTLQRYRIGIFNDKLFRLVGLESRFNHKTYQQLTSSDRRQLDDSIIHATIIRQDEPDDNGSSKFSIFERLNTSAKPLSPQEIRAAIYQGKFNDLLNELNENPDWRKLFGKTHSRKRDQELILRFLAMYFQLEDYAPPMKRFLNDFMSGNLRLETYSADLIRPLFCRTVQTILEKIGPQALKPSRAVNAALCDALLVGVARRLDDQEARVSDIKEKYDDLLENERFQASIFVGTSQSENVKRRTQLATDAFSTVE